MITSISVYQSNVDDCNLLAVHSPIVFLIDVVYTATAPNYIFAKVYDGLTLKGTFKTIPYSDVTPNTRRFMFIADSILRGYMDDYEDFEQTSETLVHVEEITKPFEIVFTDPEENAPEYAINIVACRAVRQFGEDIAMCSIYNNETEIVKGIKGYPCYVYFYNSSEGGIVSLSPVYLIEFVITDSVGFVNEAIINIDGNIIETDSGGEAFTYLANGTYPFTIYKYGYYKYSGSIVVSGAGILIEYQLLEAPLFEIEFTVTDGTNPINLAAILIDGEAAIYTDINGIATIDLYPCEREFTVNKIGFAEYSDSFEIVDADINVSVEMVALVEYECLFTVESSLGGVLENAKITINGADYYTDIDGEVVVDGLTPNTYSFVASKNYYYPIIGEITIVNMNITETVILNPV